jgi:hypothetical protein
MGVEVDSINVGFDGGEGLAPGLSMNRCAVMVAGTVLAGAFAGGNSYYCEELLSALVLFALVALPLLALAFSLAMVEAGAERGMPWAKARSGELAASLRCLAQAGRQRLLLYRHAASASPQPQTEKSADPSVNYSFVTTRLRPPGPRRQNTRA